MTASKHPSRRLDRLSDYSNESLLDEVRRIACVLARTDLTEEDIENHGRCSYAILKKRFGGLHAALKAAGLAEKDFNRNVPKEELLRELARIGDLLLTHEGRRPYTTDLTKYHARFSRGPYYRYWGSWIKACEALLEWEGALYDAPACVVDVMGDGRPRVPRKKRPIPLRVRYAILLRDRFTCQRCGRSPSATAGLQVDVDHIVPEPKGGALDPANLRCLCQECNVGKGSLDEW
jgi:hypothetical protein